MKVVLDTNVIVSGLLSDTGPPAILLGLVQSGRLEMGVSRALVDELMRVIARPRIEARLRDESSARVVRLLRRATLLRPSERVIVFTADESDNHLLEAVVEFEALYLVTGDQAARSLGSFRSATIVTPAEFVASLGTVSGDG